MNIVLDLMLEKLFLFIIVNSLVLKLQQSMKKKLNSSLKFLLENLIFLQYLKSNHFIIHHHFAFM